MNEEHKIAQAIATGDKDALLEVAGAKEAFVFLAKSAAWPEIHQALSNMYHDAAGAALEDGRTEFWKGVRVGLTATLEIVGQNVKEYEATQEAVKYLDEIDDTEPLTLALGASGL